ncbi:hypothetical protein BRC92_00750 [Halobacteriales archaeon QS_4_69_31]|nr:MAG: hypothetical protein BRC92_00750 [Halobacteriales archaeon QS_4_69_31]
MYSPLGRDRMDRRRFLATSVAGLGATAAGCVAVGGTKTLGSPGEEIDDDGAEKHLTFVDGDREVAVVSLDQMDEQASPTDSFRFRIHVEHGTAEDERASTVERFRFDLRAPPASVAPPAEVYLQAPGGGLWPDFTFEEVENFWTRIEAGGTDEVGSGALTLAFIVDPLGIEPDELGVRASVGLSVAGPTTPDYRLETETRFEPVVSGPPEG